jgi:hypothetical protein
MAFQQVWTEARRYSADYALQAAPPSPADPPICMRVLAQARLQGVTSSPDWLRRYRDGKREVVWHELRQLGATVRERQYASEAQAVCDEMAQRTRRNIDIIIDVLSRDGYRFHENDNAQTPTQPFAPPSSKSESHVEDAARNLALPPTPDNTGAAASNRRSRTIHLRLLHHSTTAFVGRLYSTVMALWVSAHQDDMHHVEGGAEGRIAVTWAVLAIVAGHRDLL